MLQKEIDQLKQELSEILLENPAAESKKKTDASIPDEFLLSGFQSLIQKKWMTYPAIGGMTQQATP